MGRKESNQTNKQNQTLTGYLKAFRKECVSKNEFSYFCTKTYVVGTQKNHLNETLLLSTQKKCFNLWLRYSQFYAQFFYLS